MSNSRHSLVVAAAPVVDALTVFVSGWLAYLLRWQQPEMPPAYSVAVLLGAVLVLPFFPASGAYQSWQGRLSWHEAGNAVIGLFAVAIVLVILATLTKTTALFSRLWMGYWFLLALALLLLSRRVFRLLERRGVLSRQRPARVLIVGDGDFARSTGRRLLAAGGSGLTLAGFIRTGDTPGCDDLPGTVLGDLVALQEIVSVDARNVDEIWIAMSRDDPARQQAVMDILQNSCVPIRYVPDLSTLALINHVPAEVAGMTVIDLNASPLTGRNALVKNVFDRLFALAALLIMAPLLLLIALLVKLDSPGPVFFVQRRHGWDGRIIKVLKFRTMAGAGDSSGRGPQATRNDARVTAVGRFLRRTSLDELAQFINVLRGDMSVVGPRPHPVALNENFTGRIAAYMQRHRVKPGITGWAQINGFRGETETLEKMRKRIEYDLYYIEHWSLWLDITIIVRTIAGGWTSDNAY